MSDKYKHLKKKIHKQRSKEKMCLNKVAFETQELAYQKGQANYKCKYCGKWHRSGQMTKFIVQLKNSINDLR